MLKQENYYLEPLASSLAGHGQESLHGEVVGGDHVQVESSSVTLALHLGADINNFLLVLAQFSTVEATRLQRILEITISVEQVEKQLQTLSVHVHVESICNNQSEISTVMSQPIRDQNLPCERTNKIVEVHRARLELLGASLSSLKNLATSPETTNQR